jgi:poly[(R)-3-hydroxyalkanoate] polymerase subunit PhaC
MASTSTQPTWDPVILAGQLQKIAQQSQTLMQRFVSNHADATKTSMGDTSTLGFDFFELLGKMMTDPAAVATAQIDLFNNSLAIWQKTAERMFMPRVGDTGSPKDKRFKHPEWSENAIFSFVKDTYLVAAESVLSAIRDVKDMDQAKARKVDFYTRQLAPTRRRTGNTTSASTFSLSRCMTTKFETLCAGRRHRIYTQSFHLTVVRTP